MRQETIDIYKFSELSEELKETVIENWRNTTIETGDFHWTDEIVRSLKELFNNLDGISLDDYSLGSYDRNNHLKVNFDNYDAEDVTGSRALAYIENNLLSNIRITRQEYRAKRKEYFNYGSSYRIGKVKPCPFTGYCADDVLLEALLNNIKDGMSLLDSLRDLADVAARLIEDEEEYQLSNEYIRETLGANEYEFTQDGAIY